MLVALMSDGVCMFVKDNENIDLARAEREAYSCSLLKYK